LDYPHFSLVGKPDRIDQHKDGLFILDYKSSSAVPHGSEILQQRYRLQLPFYALAVKKRFNQPILGVQFVELNRKGARKSGILFKKHNGKEPGKLTQLRSNSKSLFDVHPEEIWSLAEEALLRDAESFLQGKFVAKPRTERAEKECSSCSLGDLCGLRRRAASESMEDSLSE
jgi:ATP-dependent helicase/DNAse subunit B